jgi:alkylation response protein AidB-like acyl-CoA dehydrogenase
MKASLEGDQYVLNGTKMFVMDANVADQLLVAAHAAEQGISLFLVDAKDPGIACTKMPTIGMDNCCEVVFKDVKVPKSDVLGEPGKGWQALEAMAAKAIVAKCAEMVGGSKACIDMTAEYAKERVQYGKPIGGYQAIQHFMADMLVAYDTSSGYLYKVAWMADAGLDFTTEASLLKSSMNQNYEFVSERACHIHGGIGTTREADIGLFFRRAKAFTYILGDSEYHDEKVAQAILSGKVEL